MRVWITTLLAALAVLAGVLVVGSAAAEPGGQNWKPASAAGIEYRPVQRVAFRDDTCRCLPAAIATVRVFGCRSWKQWPSTAFAQCDGGVGGVRVVGDCWYQQGDYTVRLYGPYVGAGSISSAVICGGGAYIVNAFYQAYGF